ncbi:MAG: hypothetical protein WB870_01530 [Gallionellaceae bacterium]
MKPYWILFFALMTGGTASAREYTVLDGDMVIAKEPLTDPLPDGDPVAYITLRGKNAEQIYQQLDSKMEQKNVCNTEGMSARLAGNLICFRNKENQYSCSFGARLTDGWLVLGNPC